LLIHEIKMAAAEAEKVVAPALPIPNFSDIGKAANDVSKVAGKRQCNHGWVR
jgi:hypothetical protein